MASIHSEYHRFLTHLAQRDVHDDVRRLARLVLHHLQSLAEVGAARRGRSTRLAPLTEMNWSAGEAAAAHGVTPATARKWLGRYLAGGDTALVDASSRPARSPRAIDPAKALLIVELRRRPMTQAHTARSVGVSESTVS